MGKFIFGFLAGPLLALIFQPYLFSDGFGAALQQLAKNLLG